MADNLQPTTEDLARDAAADLAVCESATPGPWHRETFPLDGKYGRSEYHEVTQGPANDASQRFCLTDDLLAKDGDFIALARTALPAWIRRAVAAEAEVARLRDAMQKIVKACDFISARDPDTIDHHALYASYLSAGRVVRAALTPPPPPDVP